MPRRSAPSPLLLSQGPLPPRGRSKFTMPSVPRPIFHPPSVVSRGPAPRQRVDTMGRNGELGYGLKGVQGGMELRVGGSGKVRGPWDHSGSYTIIATTVEMPARAAVGVF